MTDIYDKSKRSYVMSKVKSIDTKPEIIVRKYLHSKGLRFRLYNKKLPGTPDLTFPKYKTAIFINGCFWHGHKNCKYSELPKTNTNWWKNKIKKTTVRDKKAIRELKKIGYNTLTVWECDLKSGKKTTTLEKLYKLITNESKNDKKEKRI